MKPKRPNKQFIAEYNKQLAEFVEKPRIAGHIMVKLWKIRWEHVQFNVKKAWGYHVFAD